MDELSLVGEYCDEFRSSINEGVDPGEFGLDNFRIWLESMGQEDEGEIESEEEFRSEVIAAGFDPDNVTAGD